MRTVFVDRGRILLRYKISVYRLADDEIFTLYKLASIGGEEADVNEFPWAALLELRSSETNRESRCGGSLISDRHVLTAGHCLKEFSNKGDIKDLWDDITVVLGEIEMRISMRNCRPLHHALLKLYKIFSTFMVLFSIYIVFYGGPVHHLLLTCKSKTLKLCFRKF